MGTAVLQAGLVPSLALTSAVLGCLCTGNGDPLWNAGSTRGAQRQDPLPAAPRGVFTLRAEIVVPTLEGSLNRQVRFHSWQFSGQCWKAEMQGPAMEQERQEWGVEQGQRGGWPSSRHWLQHGL